MTDLISSNLLQSIFCSVPYYCNYWWIILAIHCEVSCFYLTGIISQTHKQGSQTTSWVFIVGPILFFKTFCESSFNFLARLQTWSINIGFLFYVLTFSKMQQKHSALWFSAAHLAPKRLFPNLKEWVHLEQREADNRDLVQLLSVSSARRKLTFSKETISETLLY